VQHGRWWNGDRRTDAPIWVQVTLGTAFAVAIGADLFASLTGSQKPNPKDGQTYAYAAGTKGSHHTVYLTHSAADAEGMIILTACLVVAITLPVYLYYVFKKFRSYAAQIGLRASNWILVWFCAVVRSPTARGTAQLRSL
jgi:hypothetical protein